MPTLLKSKNLDFKEDPSAPDNFKLQTASPRLSNRVNSEHLLFDIRLLNPEQYSFPYHFHRHAEELMLILSGSLTLRTPDGLQEVHQGDIIFFEMGESSAHQLYNHTQVPCTYLDIKTSLANDICEYPDSGKIAVSPSREIYEKTAQVDYFKGEENIGAIWENLKKSD